MKLLSCPFCGAAPHRGQAKAFRDQMHGELLHHYKIWCPHGCASLRRINEELTVSAWNTRFDFSKSPMKCEHIWATQDDIGRPYCAACGLPWSLTVASALGKSDD
jgi:hypothetical protein